VSAPIARAFADADTAHGTITHGYTFSAHPVAAAAALATLDIFEREPVIQNAATQGEYLHGRLAAMAQRCRLVGDTRGIGLMACLELVADKSTRAPLPRGAREVTQVAREAYRRGAMVRTSGGNIILSPALTIERAQVDLLCDALEGALQAVAA
jgi:putrescine---pyruvate transaminase